MKTVGLAFVGLDRAKGQGQSVTSLTFPLFIQVQTHPPIQVQLVDTTGQAEKPCLCAPLSSLDKQEILSSPSLKTMGNYNSCFTKYSKLGSTSGPDFNSVSDTLFLI